MLSRNKSFRATFVASSDNNSPLPWQAPQLVRAAVASVVHRPLVAHDPNGWQPLGQSIVRTLGRNWLFILRLQRQLLCFFSEWHIHPLNYVLSTCSSTQQSQKKHSPSDSRVTLRISSIQLLCEVFILILSACLCVCLFSSIKAKFKMKSTHALARQVSWLLARRPNIPRLQVRSLVTGHRQNQPMNECINELDNKSMFISLPSCLPISLSQKPINKN